MRESLPPDLIYDSSPAKKTLQARPQVPHVSLQRIDSRERSADADLAAKISIDQSSNHTSSKSRLPWINPASKIEAQKREQEQTKRKKAAKPSRRAMQAMFDQQLKEYINNVRRQDGSQDDSQEIFVHKGKLKVRFQGLQPSPEVDPTQKLASSEIKFNSKGVSDIVAETSDISAVSHQVPIIGGTRNGNKPSILRTQNVPIMARKQLAASHRQDTAERV